jgi:hypothetical protein
MNKLETINELKAFFGTETNRLKPFFYPMSGLDFEFIKENSGFLFTYIFCDYNFESYYNGPSIENKLGLHDFEITSIETLSDEAFNFLNGIYKNMDKSAGFREWYGIDAPLPPEVPEQNELQPIKKYRIEYGGYGGSILDLILLQGEAACTSRLLQHFELNLNLIINLPDGPFNGEGATEFFKIYKRITEYEPQYVLGSDFNELDGLIRLNIKENMNCFSASEDLNQKFSTIRDGHIRAISKYFKLKELAKMGVTDIS